MALSNPGPVALRAATDAEANIGVTEQGGNNRGKNIELYQTAVGCQPGDPWCACFVHFRLARAAALLGKTLPAGFPCSGYCPDYEDWAREHGVWIPVAAAMAQEIAVQRGDLGLFWFASKGRVAHTGIVTGGMTGGVVTVEGNTSPEAGSGVNRDGDGVWRKHRPWASFGAHGGFVRIAA